VEKNGRNVQASAELSVSCAGRRCSSGNNPTSSARRHATPFRRSARNEGSAATVNVHAASWAYQNE